MNQGMHTSKSEGNQVTVDVAGLETPTWLSALESFAQRVLMELSKECWDLSILVCDEAFMADLNKRYRAKDGSTDVLSFEQGEWYEGPNGRRYLAGDVVICPAVVSRNALEFGVSMGEELKRVVVHGILHMSGMDHASNEADEPMLVFQENFLKRFAEERLF